MLIIGCDFHPGFQQVAIFDNRTGEIQEKRLQHRAEAEQFYRGLAGQEVRVGMEACGHYPWFERLLEEIGIELWMGMRRRCGLGGTAAEDGPAGRGALVAVAAGGSVSADLGAESGGAGCAAVAGASAQAGAGADAHQEPVAVDGAEQWGAEEVEAVDESRASGVGAVAVAAVCGGAAKAVAGSARRAGSGDRRTGPASDGRSAPAISGGETDDASGSGTGDGVGHGVNAGAGGEIRIGQASGQLLRPDSE